MRIDSREDVLTSIIKYELKTGSPRFTLSAYTAALFGCASAKPRRSRGDRLRRGGALARAQAQPLSRLLPSGADPGGVRARKRSAAAEPIAAAKPYKPYTRAYKPLSRVLYSGADPEGSALALNGLYGRGYSAALSAALRRSRGDRLRRGGAVEPYKPKA